MTVLDVAEVFGPDVPFDTRVTRELEALKVRREAKRLLDAELAIPIITPEVLTLDDWLRQPDPIVSWRIESWQPADSRVMLAAQFKSGKTTARDNLVRALADGDPWLGTYRVR